MLVKVANKSSKSWSKQLIKVVKVVKVGNKSSKGSPMVSARGALWCLPIAANKFGRK